MSEPSKIDAVELIAAVLQDDYEERQIVEEWRVGGHLDLARRWEIAWYPDRASEQENSHLAACERCRSAVNLFRDKADGASASARAQPTRRPMSVHYQLAQDWGAAAKTGTDATSADHANWQTVELSDGPLEVTVHRVEAGVPDVWIRLQKRGDPGLGRAFALTLGNVHRLCVLVPDFNNLWTAGQKIEGETARRLSAAGEIELREIDLTDLVPEDLPVLLESLRFAWKPQKLRKALDAWLAGHDNTPGAVVIRQALASPST